MTAQPLMLAVLLALSSATLHRVPRLPARPQTVTVALARSGDLL